MNKKVLVIIEKDKFNFSIALNDQIANFAFLAELD